MVHKPYSRIRNRDVESTTGRNDKKIKGLLERLLDENEVHMWIDDDKCQYLKKILTLILLYVILILRQTYYDKRINDRRCITRRSNKKNKSKNRTRRFIHDKY